MKKTSPKSIRFRQDYFDKVKEIEKLETGQQVVDFLLEKYWWETQFPNKQWSPPPNIAHEMGLGANVRPNANPKPLTISSPAVDEYEALRADILATTYSEDLKKVMKEVEASGVGAVKKAKLRAIANDHRINFTN